MISPLPLRYIIKGNPASRGTETSAEVLLSATQKVSKLAKQRLEHRSYVYTCLTVTRGTNAGNYRAVQSSTTGCKTIPQRLLSGSHQADTLPFWKKAPLGSSFRGSVASMTAFCAPG